MFFKIAVRNIFAYAKRSIITVLLLACTTALLVFASAYMDGSHARLIQSSVEIYPGYIQITHHGFRDNPSLENLIFAADEVSGRLRDFPGLAVLAARFESFVLFSSADKAVGAMFTAIEPEKERQISRLAASLKEGSYLTSDDDALVYLGSELARRLKVGVGDQLAFVGTAADYSFAADNLTVKGIFQTGLFEFDSRASFVAKPYFDRMMAAENYATHFIAQPERPAEAAALAAAIGARLGPEFDAASWQQTMAGLVQAMRVDSIFGYITLAIIFIVIFFVVMIYTLLVVYARVREIGILRAVGTGPGQIFAMLLLESVLLGLVSVLLGGLIGGALAWYFHLHPIVFTGMEEQFKQYGLALTDMPTAFAPLVILRDMAVMFVLSVAATLYPICKVNAFKPIEAIHHV
ncbi:MAG: FtsX-like permease family protein [Desulfurivibrio sp.]|nr:MAG: FtsX-like permease family protein [Desulfurivibrio sp.]